MEYIIRLKGTLTSEKEDIIRKRVNKIYYKSDFIPVIGVVSKTADKIKELKFVKNVRSSRKGSFQEDDFSSSSLSILPALDKRVLVRNQFVGWGVNIAILDSGINRNEVNVNECIDFTGTGTSDTLNHGTLVAKLIDNFATGAKLYSIKVGAKRPDEINVMRGIEWAVNNGMTIMNISSSFEKEDGCDGTCELCELVNKISSLDKAIVASAGNKKNKLDSISCPGIATNSITVGASDEDKNIASYSSFGKPGGNKPNIIAPGSIYLNGDRRTGTSFAAPIISGVLGAILPRVSNLQQAIQYIYESADDLNLSFHKQGFGHINLRRLVEVILSEESGGEGKGQGRSS